MTLVVSWAGIDCKNGKLSPVASIYFASDSRYSWSSGQINDYGQKVFGCKNSPEIFALCGDVNFPKMAIMKCISRIDNATDFAERPASSKANEVREMIENELSMYNIRLIVEDFHLFHGTRSSDGFHVFRYDYDKSKKVLCSNEIPIPVAYSDIIYYEGSGKYDFYNRWKSYYTKKQNINHRTSRAVYQCLYETLSTTEKYTLGKIPQIVGLYRKFNCRFFGIVNNGKRYYFGKNGIMEVSDDDLKNLSQVEWRNERFEVTNPYTMMLKKGAQPQPFDKEANPFLSTKNH